MKDPFAAYKLPIGLMEGVTINLPGTKAEFRVKLPSAMNEDFQMAVMRELSFETVADDKTGEPVTHVDPMKFQAVRKRLFFDTCILGATGLPKDMPPGDFFAAYPLAAKAIYEQAEDLTITTDKDVEVALEKLNASQSGKSSGLGKRSNTKTLSKPE